ncbi:MAG: TonB-dependent receptor plug domain-containing protein [Parahaliea sp.]
MSSQQTLAQIDDSKTDEAISKRTLEEVLVTGQHDKQPFKSGNMDLIRTENDIQPYISIDRSKIEASGASTVEELMRQSLSMSTGIDNASSSSWTGTSSQFNLRGLGADQTLVLINGRRGAGIGTRGRPESGDQQDVNSIPLAAIERIEVLPTSASAIYGSNALGGVINIILRRDYQGLEVGVRHSNTFDSDQGQTTMNFTGGFNIEDGKTKILISAQRQEQNGLLIRDRDFFQSARATTLRNNPDTIYGMNDQVAVNPPYGALVNVRSLDGSPLFPNISEASYLYLPRGYTGWQTEGIEPLLQNLGQYNLELSEGLGSFRNGFSGINFLVPESRKDAILINMDRNFSDSFNIFLDMNYTQSQSSTSDFYHALGVVTITADNPTNPFGKDVLVAAPIRPADGLGYARRTETEEKNASLGFNWQINPDWLINADITWGNSLVESSYLRRTNAQTRMYNAAIASGELDLLRDTSSYTTDISPYWTIAPNFSDQTLRSVTLRSFATVATWYAGDITMATGLERREFKSKGRFEVRYINDPNTPINRQDQTTDSYYSEFKIPLISSEMDIPWLYQFELQLAGRYEKYDIKTTGAQYSKFSPTYGFSLSPNNQLMLRASYGEGFKTPTIAQLSQPTLSTSESIVLDPVTGNTVSLYTVGGGNPNLKPEEAESINVGLVITPATIPELRISADYFRIKKENNITSLSAQNVLNNENFLPGRVERDTQGNVTGIDTTYFNALWMKTSGIDVRVSYADNLFNWGHFGLSLSYTYTDEYKQQETLMGDAVSYLGSVYDQGPIRHRISSSLSFKPNKNWTIGWNTQYYGDYRQTSLTAALNQGTSTIPSQTYHDLYIQAVLPDTIILGRPELTFGIRNIFDESQVDLAFSNTLSSYSDPRLRQGYMNIKFVL